MTNEYRMCHLDHSWKVIEDKPLWCPTCGSKQTFLIDDGSFLHSRLEMREAMTDLINAIIETPLCKLILSGVERMNSWIQKRVSK